MVNVLAGVAAPAQARTGDLKRDRAQAREVAAQIATLDGQIASAVLRYSQASCAMEAVRQELRENRRLQSFAYEQLRLARATLLARAVAMYKHEDVTTLDAVFGAADLGDLVTQISMVRTIARSDRDVVRVIERTRRELRDRSATLAADERTIKELVIACRSDLATIRAQLGERQAVLTNLRADIRRLVSRTTQASSKPTTTVEPPTDMDGGCGSWWPSIKSAAASNGVSARGLYRLMMIESGGSATIVGPGGFYGLFQYAPSTWKGSWNPWRGSAITDGAAQIKATALAIRLGYGHAWWDPSYSWAFQGD